MANNKVKMTMELDFVSNKTSLNRIKQQIEAASEMIELNMELDPKDQERALKYLREFGKAAETSFNEATGMINKKMLDGILSNSDVIPAANEMSNALTKVGVDGRESISSITDSNKLFTKSLDESDTVLTRMGETLTNTIRWQISSSVVNSFTGAIRDAYYFSKDLDRSLTNIMIVSGESAENMAVFTKEANTAAKALGTTTLEYVDAATLFYQQGLRGDDITNMTDAATIASNITGVAAAEMSSLLTATMNGFKISSEEVMTVVDKLAAVGANTASDFEQLATGMSKVASMANAAGVDIDQLNGQLATIISVTQESPESIGTALKTIYGRMLAFKNNTSDMMEDEDGEMFGVPSVEAALEKFSAATGEHLSLFETLPDGSEELRDLGEVIEEIGNSWDKTSDKAAKLGLTTALAGSRQQNRLIALFDAWEDYGEAMGYSMDSEGTAMEQNAVVLDSYDAKLKQLQATKEQVFIDMTESGGMKDLIDGLTVAVEFSGKLLETIGGVTTVVSTLASVVASIALPKGMDALGNMFTDKSNQKEAMASAMGLDVETYKNLVKVQKQLGDESAEFHRQKIVQLEKQQSMAKISTEHYKDMARGIKRVTKDTRELASVEEGSNSLKHIQDIIAANKERLKQVAIVKASAESEKEAEGAEEYARALIEQNKHLERTAQLKREIGTKINMGEDFSDLTEQANRSQEAALALGREMEGMQEKYTRLVAQEVGGLNAKTNELKEQRQVMKDISDDYDRQQKILGGINTALRMGLPLIKTARDETKSGTDLLKVGLSTLLMSMPTIIAGIRSAREAMVAVRVATQGSATAAALFSAAMGSSLGPILAIAAGASAMALYFFKANDGARELQDTLDDFEESSQASDELQYEKLAIEQEKEDLEEEIRLLKQTRKSEQDAEYREELEVLEKELLLLEYKAEATERELILAERQEDKDTVKLLNLERESELVEKIHEIEGARFTQEGEMDTLNPVEELETLISGYEKLEGSLASYEARRDALAEKKSFTEKDSEDMKRHLKDIRETEKALEDQASKMATSSSELKKLAESLSGNSKESERLRKEIQDLTGASDDAIDRLLGIADAQEDLGDETDNTTKIISEQEKLLSTAGDRYDEYADKVFDLYETISDTTTTEYDSIAAKEELAGVMTDLLGIPLDEAFFHNAENMDLLSMALEGSESAWMQLHFNAVGAEMDIMGVAEQFDLSGQQMSQIIGALDLLEFEADGSLNTEAFFASIEGMGIGIGAAQALLEELGSTTVDFELKEQKIQMAEIMSEGIDGISNKTAMSTIKSFKANLNQSKVAAVNSLAGIGNNVFKGRQSYSARRPSTGSKRGGGSSGRKPSGGSGGKKPSGGSGSGSEKEVYAAEAEAYAQINAELERNNALMSMNSTLQGHMLAGSSEYVESLEKEAKLQKNRQKLLHQLNQEMRNRGKELQRELSGRFNFTGNLDDNTLFITNLNAIEGASKETEEAFNELKGIMQALPGASEEWHQIQQRLEDIEIEKFQIKVQNIEKALWSLGETMSELDFIMNLDAPEDYGANLSYLEEKAELTQQTMDQLFREIKKLEGEGFKKGTRGAEVYKEEMERLTQTLKDNRLAHAELKREMQSLYEARKEEVANEWMDSENKKLQEERDRISAVEMIQEKIVAIIRKRGENERAELEKTHSTEMELMQDAENERRKKNQTMIDEYREAMQDKISALDEQHKEEDYLENLAKEQEALYDLDKRLSILSSDDSLTARNLKIKLEEDIANQKDKIAKMQRQHSRQEEKKALKDAMDDRIKDLNDKEKLAQETFDKEKEAFNDLHKRKLEAWEEQYSNASVYAEAAEAFRKGQVKNMHGEIQSIEKAMHDFMDEFESGLGLLGPALKQDLVEPLRLAAELIERINSEGIDITRPKDDYTEAPDHVTDGIEKPEFVETESKIYQSRENAFKDWSEEDFMIYFFNKQNWDMGSETEKNQRNKANENLRKKYGMPKDDYHWTQTNQHSKEDEFYRQRISDFQNWQKEDLITYYRNKQRWTKGDTRLEAENQALRMKYGMKTDKYHWKDISRFKGFKDGGVMDQTGLFMGHGSERSSEVVFSARTAKKLWESIEAMPDISNLVRAKNSRSIPAPVVTGNNEYNIKFEVEGNLDSSLLPEIERVVSSAIDRSEFKQRKELEKIGQFRPLR